MITPAFRALGLLWVTAAALSAPVAPPAAAADVAEHRGAHSAVRLVGGGSLTGDGMAVRRRGETTDPTMRAGVQITLAPGWKTYWRYPGDSGIPPRFDFSASTNIRTATVHWPAPMRFADGGGTSIGYAGSVIFPVTIEAERPQEPVRLRLKLDYAICEKLCVPDAADVSLALAGHGRPSAALLRSEARVPVSTELGAGGSLAIVAVRRVDGTASRPVVEVDVRNADGGVDLFAEGPTAQWSLPLPEPVPGAPPGMQRFAFELDGLPPGESAEHPLLRLTAVSSTQAIEVISPLPLSLTAGPAGAATDPRP